VVLKLKIKKMRKLFFLIASILVTVNILAQAPQKMSYQAVIRNSSNVLVESQSVGIRINILQGSVKGNAVYIETHNTTTNANGLVSIEIGAGTVLTGTFSTINWADGPYFVKTETDPSGGSNYTISGTSQLLSVPYAMHSKTAESIGLMGSQGQVLTMCDGKPTWTNGGQCPGNISSLNCANMEKVGSLSSGVPASGVKFMIPYIGGNGGIHNGQIVNSTGVLGLTATLLPGNFAIGNDTLVYSVSGTPSSSGNALFQINIGGKTCNISINVQFSLTLGDTFGGGIVGYIFQPGDFGYVAGETHGIIAAINDLPTLYTWGPWNPTAYSQYFQNISVAIGKGKNNTDTILSVAGIMSSNFPAAHAAKNYTNGIYNDWFLPSKNELLALKTNLANNNKGNFYTSGTQTTGYWSSSVMENYVGALAPIFDTNSNVVCGCAVFEAYRVRPIRYF
jgi:hypothetical protein